MVTVREPCLIVSGNTLAMTTRAVRSVMEHAPDLIAVVLQTEKDRCGLPAWCAERGITCSEVPRALATAHRARRHGIALDWWLEHHGGWSEHTWFLDSDAWFLTPGATDSIRPLARPLCGIHFARTPLYWYARPACMCVDAEWLYRHAAPWCRIRGRGKRFSTRFGPIPEAWDTTERLSIWCRQEDRPIGLLKRVGPKAKPDRWGVNGQALLAHWKRGTQDYKGN